MDDEISRPDGCSGCDKYGQEKAALRGLRRNQLDKMRVPIACMHLLYSIQSAFRKGFCTKCENFRPFPAFFMSCHGAHEKAHDLLMAVGMPEAPSLISAA